MALSESDELVLLHNPRCSKSRAARALLEERGVRFEERLYLEDALGRAELDDLQRRLNRPPQDWVRKGESAYREAGLDANSGPEAILDAMAKYPILIERPIAVHGKRARVGRPPEDVLELL